jgi:type I site-specific restriction endonuclease
MDKKALSERDICTKFITPAIENAEWDRHTHYLEEVTFTEGKIYVKGKLTARGNKKKPIISSITSLISPSLLHLMRLNQKELAKHRLGNLRL